MVRVGLTGGIGCGKSTVAAMMRELGCRVLEADPLAHRLIEPGEPAYNEILNEFGRGILAAGGRIDRPRLAEIVFSDPTRLERLNRIVHPRVLDALNAQLAEIARAEPQAVAVVEAALLVESGHHSSLDRLVVVWCEPKQQMDRLTHPTAGRGMSLEQAAGRIAAQMPLEEKRRLADDVIDCSGSLEETRSQVERLVAKFKAMAASTLPGKDSQP